MLKAADREKEGWLDDKFINNFPCTDLRTIDQLWVKYSSGRFGFSIQKRIWQNVRVTKPKNHVMIMMALVYGNDTVADAESFEYFSDRIGWQSLNRTLGDHELIFSKEAPEGHLPVFGFFKPFWRIDAFGKTYAFIPVLAESGRLFSYFFSRLDACEDQQVE